MRSQTSTVQQLVGKAWQKQKSLWSVIPDKMNSVPTGPHGSLFPDYLMIQMHGQVHLCRGLGAKENWSVNSSLTT